jgi:hypothetical protein
LFTESENTGQGKLLLIFQRSDLRMINLLDSIVKGQHREAI